MRRGHRKRRALWVGVGAWVGGSFPRTLLGLACAAALLVSPDTARAAGPYLEAVGGLGMQTLQETGGSANLETGYSAGLTAGVPATSSLGVELVAVISSSGSVTSSRSVGGSLAREWNMSAYLLGLRYRLARPVRDLDVGLSAGLGITQLDIAVVDSDITDQQASAFTYYLAGRAAYHLVAGLYVGSEARLLITPTWRDDDAENVELDSFGTVPFLLQGCVGYELDLF